MVENIRDTLKALSGKWDGVAPREGLGAHLPSARYQFEISAPSSGVLVNKDSDGAIRGRIVLTVVGTSDAALEGKVTSKSWTIVDKDGSLSEMGVSILKADLELLGIPCASPAAIPEALQAACGMIVDATVKLVKKDDGIERENIYFNACKGSAPGKGGKGGKGGKAPF